MRARVHRMDTRLLVGFGRIRSDSMSPTVPLTPLYLAQCQTRKGSIRVYLFKLIRTQVDGREATVLTIESMPTASP